jgi:hypothetical protein
MLIPLTAPETSEAFMSPETEIKRERVRARERERERELFRVFSKRKRVGCQKLRDGYQEFHNKEHSRKELTVGGGPL